MKNKKNLKVMFAFLFIVLQQSIAQQKIKGAVTDAEGTPLIGVSIIEEGTANGQITDFDGNYSIEVLNSNASLVFSYLGFTQKKLLLVLKLQ